MSLQVEKLEKNMAKLTVEVSAEDFKAAIKKAFLKLMERHMMSVNLRSLPSRQLMLSSLKKEKTLSLQQK